jgi:hypothetical protein
MGAVANQFEEQPVLRDTWPDIRSFFAGSFCDFMENKVEGLRSVG